MDVTPTNRIQTTIPKSLVAFLSVMFVLCLGFFVSFFFFDPGYLLRIIGFVFTGFFMLFAAVMLLDLFFHYQYVEDQYLYNRIFFKKKRLKMSKIARIEKSPTHYTIYSSLGRFCSINCTDPSAEAMLFQFGRHGFDLGKIVKVAK